MRETRIGWPELGLIAATRGMMGAGIGMLMATRLRPRQRARVGWVLLAIGGLSTIPLAIRAVRRTRSPIDGQARVYEPAMAAPAS